MLIQNYSDLTLENMVLNHFSHTDFPDKTPYALSNNNGTIVIHNTVINACEDGFAFDVCRYANYPSVNVSVTGDSIINGNVEVSASSNNAQEGLFLHLLQGVLNGNLIIDTSADIAMANNIAYAAIYKSNIFEYDAPMGYQWIEDNNNTFILTKENIK